MTVGALRDKILAADDLPREKVQTDEWAPSGAPFVYVRGMTAAERDAWEQDMSAQQSRPGRPVKNVRASFVVRSIVGEDGERMFKDVDAEALGGKNAAVLDRLWDVARRLSGYGDAAGPNPSRGDQAESSSSDSP